VRIGTHHEFPGQRDLCLVNSNISSDDSQNDWNGKEERELIIKHVKISKKCIKSIEHSDHSRNCFFMVKTRFILIWASHPFSLQLRGLSLCQVHIFRILLLPCLSFYFSTDVTWMCYLQNLVAANVIVLISNQEVIRPQGLLSHE
jgi:hypothetical protein